MDKDFTAPMHRTDIKDVFLSQFGHFSVLFWRCVSD